MAAIPMNVQMGELLGDCFPSNQSLANAFAQALQVTFPLTATAINYASATPDADQQDLPWYRLNPDGTPDNWYVFINGNWIRPNPIPASSPIRQFYCDSASSIDTYDGGESNTLSAVTGPMWEIDGAMGSRFPLGADPVNYPQGTIGGESTHTLTINEMPSHTHPATGSNATLIQWAGAGGPEYDRLLNNANNPTWNNSSDPIQATGGGAAHNNIPPYLSGYWIKRTSRIFYRI